MKAESKICFECFIAFEKFDELQQQVESVRNKMANIFHRTHSEKVFVKQEPDEDLSDRDWIEPEMVSVERGASEDLSDEMFDSSDSSIGKEENLKEKTKKFFCEDCDKSFNKANLLAVHIATDHDRNNGPVDCPICFTTLKGRAGLLKHINLHSERKFLCGQ